MSQYTIQHGARHGPRGSDPAPTDVWHEIATPASAWFSATTYGAGVQVSHGTLNFLSLATSTAVEPQVTAGWGTYWAPLEPTFVNGSNATPTVDVPNPVPLRFRLSVGPPNDCEYDPESPLMNALSIDRYSEHQIEIQGDVTGLITGDVVFVLPLEYTHDFDVPYHTHDDTGLYVPCRLLSTGEFIWNTP